MRSAFDEFCHDLDRASNLSDDPFAPEVGELDEDDIGTLSFGRRRAPASAKPAARKPATRRKKAA